MFLFWGYNSFSCENAIRSTFFTGLCSTVEIKMKDDAFKPVVENSSTTSVGRYQGMYERSIWINGKPSWNNSDNAIWYISKSNEWVVGNLIDRGHTDRNIHNMYAKNDLGGLTDADKQWKYYDFGGLIDTSNLWKYWNGSEFSQIDSTNLNVSCKGT